MFLDTAAAADSPSATAAPLAGVTVACSPGLYAVVDGVAQARLLAVGDNVPAAGVGAADRTAVKPPRRRGSTEAG